jgi:hypothetical protein
MSDWSYVAIAYTIVWGGLAAYALALARRVYQANALDRQLSVLSSASDGGESDTCDDVQPGH